MAAGRDRQSLFAQALIQGPSRLSLPFTNLCLSFSHPHLRPSLPLSGGSLEGNKQRRSGTPDPRLLGNHTLTWWSGGNFRSLCENSIKVVISPEFRLPPQHAHIHTKCSPSVYVDQGNTWKHARNMWHIVKKVSILCNFCHKGSANRCMSPLIICISVGKSDMCSKSCWLTAITVHTSCILLFWCGRQTSLSPPSLFFYEVAREDFRSLLPAKDECGFDNNRGSY